MKKPSKKSLSTSISVSEFKSWMSGVEDMQEDDWVPNKQQWERIKSKIELLSDEAIVAQQDTQQGYETPYPVVQQQSRLGFNAPRPIPEQSFFGTTHHPDYTPQPDAFFNPTPLVVTDQSLAYTNGENPDFL